MRINNNIQALNAYRNLYNNQMRTSSNLEKLSSGLRINKAADDAAGLAISEKMRSQIRGLKQAERNALDGISLIQTSEGAMTEIHSMLQRIRELAVQAANDTNSFGDREAIQDEINQLLEEIDSIADKTEFNTRKLLNGSSAVNVVLSGVNNTNLVGLPKVEDPKLAGGSYTLRVSGVSHTQTIIQPAAGVSPNETSLIQTISGPAKLGVYTIEVKKYNPDDNTATIELLDPEGLSMGSVSAKVGTSGTSATIGNGNPSLTIDVRSISNNGTIKVKLEAEFNMKIERTSGSSILAQDKPLTTVNGKVSHGGIEFTFDSSVTSGSAAFFVTNSALNFQIGANTGQNVLLDIPQINTAILGIENVSVLSSEEANDTIFALDKAITQISSIRAKLGAMQNRLDHTVSNLQITHENLTASESRIRDADIALEMVEFTRNNILNQSAQAMLAQANQLPQGVLQLLQ